VFRNHDKNPSQRKLTKFVQAPVKQKERKSMINRYWLFLTKLSFLVLALLYIFMGFIFFNAMESTRVADFGYNYEDVVVGGIAMILWAFAAFSLLFVAWLKE